ncbi:MAG: hypothetical protein U0441_13395 [Polyangiaceae bacterium]
MGTELGGTDSDAYANLSVGSQDRLYLDLISQGTIDFGDGPLMQAGAGDVFWAPF